jgi:Ca-activated chloride channel family protein
MVVFSGEAYSLSPLTNDYELLTSLIEEINFSMIEAKVRQSARQLLQAPTA